MPKKDLPEEEILADIIEGISYNEIAKKYGIGKGTITRIKFRHEKGLQAPVKSKQEIGRRRRIQKAANTNAILKRGDMYVNNILNLQKGILFTIDKLADIQDKYEAEYEDLVKVLEILKEQTKKNFDVASEVEIFGKMALVQLIEDTMRLIKDAPRRDSIRIAAITELRKQFETYKKLNIEGEAIEHIKQLLESFFAGVAVLDDREYIKYREEVIRCYPPAKELFYQHEANMAGAKEIPANIDNKPE